MASRVNIRFVIILAIVLGGVFMGVAATAYYVVLKSASALARQADAKMAAGEYADAEFLYSKAVAKDQSNLEYLEKWRDAMVKKVPETQVEFRTDYQMYVGGILRTIATIQRTNVEAYREYLDALLTESLASVFSRGAWERLVEETDVCLRQWATYDDQQKLTPTAAHTDNSWQTLRRYSGISIVMIMNERLPLTDDLVRRAREDLEAAIAADPQDALATRFLGLWHFNQAIEAERNNDPQQADELRDQAIAILDAGLERMPNHPDLLLRKLAGKIDIVLKSTDVDESGSTAERDQQYREAVGTLIPLLDQVEQSMIDAGPDVIDAGMIATFNRLARLVDAETAAERTERLIQVVLDARPDAFDVLLVRANLADQRGEYPKEVTALESIIALDPKPVGLAGQRLYESKRTAIFQLINAETALAAINAVDGKPDPEHLASARKYRDRLAEILPEEDKFLKFADAKLNLAEGDLNGAQRLLVEYNRATNDEDPEALMMAADIAERGNQLGTAQERYERIIELQPNNVMAKYRLANLFIQMENYDEAKEYLEEVLDLAPQHAEAKEKLRILSVMQGSAQDTDPIIQALVRAENARLGRAGAAPDPDFALTILEQAISENGYEPRLAHMAARTLIQLGRMDEAMETINQGLEVQPDYALLLRLKQSIEASDSLDATLALIDSQGGDQVRTLLAKYQACRRFDDEARANQFLDEAIKVEPNDPSVVEQAFFRALRAKDMTEAERLARVAEQYDVDRANGLAFRANLLIAQDDYSGAAQALEQAVSLGTATATIWRLLGDVRWRLGETNDALTAYQEALRVNPNDLDSVTSYVAALAQAGRTDEALSVARANRRFAGRSERLLDSWLRLEGSVGDKQLAIDRRQHLASRNPDDRANLSALAELYIDTQKWQDARTLISRLRAEEDSLDLVNLSARWYAEQGDLQAAVNEYQKYAASIPEDQRTSTPLIALASFLIQRGQPADGLKVLEAASSLPDEPGVNSKMIYAEELMRRGRFADALIPIQEELDGGNKDENGEVRKLKAIALVSLKRHDEAEAVLNDMGDVATRSLQLMLLRADIAGARGDDARMRDLLNDAVAKFNDDPAAYFSRANALKADPRLIQDVMQDLNTAIQLNPGFTQALRLRAAIEFTQGRDDRGLADLRTAVAADPSQDQLRVLLMNELMKRDRVGEAQTIANDAVQARPGSRTLLTSLGDAFAGFQLWDRAAPYYATAWKIQQDLGMLERYAEALLQTNQLDAVSQLLSSTTLSTEDNAATVMIRARLLAAQGQMAGALQAAARSLDLIGTSKAGCQAWFDKARLIFPKDRPDAVVAYLNELSQSRPNNEWLPYFAVRTLLGAGQRDQAMKGIDELARSDNPEVKFEALSLRSDVLIREQKNEEAAATLKEALAIRPEDATLSNNLAYLLSERLGRPEEALGYAQRAAQSAPTNVNILDTLGATYHALGRLDDAKATLSDALRLSTADTDRASALMRLAEVAMDARNQAGALERLDQLNSLMSQNPEIEAAYRERYDALMDRLR